ncbi:hypothetical protein [Nocardia sp. BMG51109]|uniref:hypothetical protein n=1 Tax=Nocardia sp. BMG51109 TaxID=1056816 RepID=UPI0004669D63|nr:hypothetical protein [Nocardia sp. BMG51109]
MDRPEYRLGVIAVRLEVDAVFVPSVEHVGEAEIPAELVAVVDVVTVWPEAAYARRADGALPDPSGPDEGAENRPGRGLPGRR